MGNNEMKSNEDINSGPIRIIINRSREIYLSQLVSEREAI